MKEIIMANCKKHGYTEHSIYSGKLKCKQCMVEYDYQKRHRIKEKLVEYKGGKCEICGYNKCLNALDFHHRNPEDKEFALNTANYNKSFETLKKEADKCILVCSNCHREIHFEENEKRRVDFICNEFACNNLNRSTAISKLILDDVLKDIENSLTQLDISIKYNVSISTVKRFFKQNELNKKRFSCDKNDLLEAFKQTPTYSFVAKKFNTTVKVIRKYCVDNNLIGDINDIRIEKGLKPLVDKLAYI